MINKIALTATIGVVSVASLIVGLQQRYMVRTAPPAPLQQTVLGETTEPEILPDATNSAMPSPLANVAGSETASVVTALCADHDGSRVWVCSGHGHNYFAITPDAMTVDVPMDIYGLDGGHVLSCGGLQVFVDDEARAANAAACATYTLDDCRDITTQCTVQ